MRQALPLPRCLPPVPTSTLRCHDWTVDRVRAVGGGAHLLVGAVCAIRGGERLQLRRHDPQGINPADLLLELVVYRTPFPDGPASREERIIDVEPDAGYANVTILPDGPTLRAEDSASRRPTFGVTPSRSYMSERTMNGLAAPARAAAPVVRNPSSALDK